mmetsp:Transcript_35407/g.97950  ORF Transcript_35407/g.97950 Transcript_35407/m.97950 type:complete len:275 (+) Transcript_35407:743-1567(+)
MASAASRRPCICLPLSSMLCSTETFSSWRICSDSDLRLASHTSVSLCSRRSKACISWARPSNSFLHLRDFSSSASICSTECSSSRISWASCSFLCNRAVTPLMSSWMDEIRWVTSGPDSETVHVCGEACAICGDPIPVGNAAAASDDECAPADDWPPASCPLSGARTCVGACPLASCPPGLSGSRPRHRRLAGESRPRDAGVCAAAARATIRGDLNPGAACTWPHDALPREVLAVAVLAVAITGEPGCPARAAGLSRKGEADRARAPWAPPGQG